MGVTCSTVGLSHNGRTMARASTSKTTRMTSCKNTTTDYMSSYFRSLMMSRFLSGSSRKLCCERLGKSAVAGLGAEVPPFAIRITSPKPDSLTKNTQQVVDVDPITKLLHDAHELNQTSTLPLLLGLVYGLKTKYSLTVDRIPSESHAVSKLLGFVEVL